MDDEMTPQRGLVRRVLAFLVGKGGPLGLCASDACPIRWVRHDRVSHEVMGFRLPEDPR